ncbi:tocopherol cyclase family protein [bacterium]|nr:tocopherol cyclase family protein [bacterium]
MSLKNILHPARYHGFTARPPFFEGWYFKLVSADGAQRFALIPGVYLSEDPEKRHAFIQVYDSQADRVAYHRFPFSAFKASPDRFEVLIGENYFSADTVRLTIDDDLGRVRGELRFTDLHPWPERFFSPGAMGWFAWVPFMECYHGVVSLDHAISGGLVVDGDPVDFSSGRGFIEKDWGRQFPSAWIWGQSNHFGRAGTSLMLSVAVIPWLGGAFGGFIIGWMLDGKLHRFATYARSRIESLAVKDALVRLVVRNAKHRLRIEAMRASGGLLQAPTEVAMDRRIMETLDARFAISFEDLGGKTLFEGEGRFAGLETVGDLAVLMEKIR